MTYRARAVVGLLPRYPIDEADRETEEYYATEEARDLLIRRVTDYRLCDVYLEDEYSGHIEDHRAALAGNAEQWCRGWTLARIENQLSRHPAIDLPWRYL